MIFRAIIRNALLCIACWRLAALTVAYGQENGSLAEHRFVKVFDVGDAGYRDWTFPAFGLIFVVIGVIVFAFPNIMKATGIPYLNFKSKQSAFFRYSVVTFAVLWAAVAFWGTYAEHLRHKRLVQENRCRVVEGPVEHFVPMPVAGHASETFTVAGVRFSYSDFIVTNGFNNTAAYGGPINSNSYVRICYDPNHNAILRLEIRDFKGELRDYHSAFRNLFPTPRDGQKIVVPNRQANIPWYSNLFVVLYILDFIAIQILFVPYLKTFIRVATTARNCVISIRLEASRKVKLRNGLILLDAETRTIWLRPRGFNRFRISLMVAALKLDAQGKSIIGDEIRFSSGFPIIVLLFFWTAYEFFSATMPSVSGMPSPARFVGIPALFFLIVGFIHIRMLRSRMKILVEDALAELCAGG